MTNEKIQNNGMMSKFLGGMKAKLLRSLVAMFGDNEVTDAKVAAAPAEEAMAAVAAEAAKSAVVVEAAAAAAKPADKDLVACLEDAGTIIKVGATYQATVKQVQPEGVYVEMPGGKGGGMVSSRCWGTGAERAQALARVRVGDVLRVEAVTCHPQTLTAGFVLAGWNRQVNARPASGPKARPAAKRNDNLVKPWVNQASKPRINQVPKFRVRPTVVAKVSAKPAYRALPKGTMVLVDTANLIGTIEPGDLAHKLTTIVDRLKSFGYSVQYVWEHRAYAWARSLQASSADKAAVDAFVKSAEVTLVNGESDMTLLQLANQIPGSVILTRDKLRDYKEEYPDIVGSRRHLYFSSVKRDGELLLTIDGFHDAVAIPPRPQEAFIEPELEWIEPMVEEEPVVVDAARRPRGMEAVAGNCLRRGDTKRALDIYGRMAKKDPSKYCEMADIFAEGKGVPQDRKAARKFEELASSRAKMFRDRARRQRRLQAEVFRARFSSRLRLSAAA